ncbi:heavy metal translocating P-type ATPase [Desulfurispira natronophila]|uniref:Copper-exporting P-type ATPase n=1 Tax=Desulfurispira natronophila TaxID=682562 RepID=A0A7W7Y3P0_9BACT|nr:heavy metal translocating P-type ATPase [Desulfurispira natronophila]MBB5021443.1 Cu+-exporting ATPase [Desulfurispira natronophila]
MSRPLTLCIQGMNCAGCVGKIEKALNNVPGVREVTVSLAESNAVVLGSAASSELVAALDQVGYTATPAHLPPTNTQHSTDGIRTFEIALRGLTCVGCVRKVEKAIEAVEGVEKVQVELALRRAKIQGRIPRPQILLDAVTNAGYDASFIHSKQDEEEQDRQHQQDNRQLMTQAIVSLSLATVLMIIMFIPAIPEVGEKGGQALWGGVGLITLGVLWYSGGGFFRNALRAFLNHSATMDTLVAIGTGTAWVYSTIVVLAPGIIPDMAQHVYYEAAAFIIGFLNLGAVLESRAKGKASQAIRSLLDLQARSARIVIDGKEQDVPVESVQTGDLVRIRPGERIPVDGSIREGFSTLDESMLTGEPIPHEKGPDDEVSAGTINQSGSLLVEAHRVGGDTALAHIIQLVRQAQGAKPPIGRIVDKVTAVFVPLVLIIAIATSLIWYNFGPQPPLAFMLVTTMTVLIIACPCALGLATPMSIMVGVGKAASAGILIRKGDALQQAAKLRTIVLDKTGTITQGKPAVTDVFTADISRDKALFYAATLESVSEHPLAHAILESARGANIEYSTATGFHSFAGKGIRGQVNSKDVILGNEAMLQTMQIKPTRIFAEHAQKMAALGQTTMYLAVDGEVTAVIAVSDPVKNDSVEAISQLRAMGLRVIMLSGDNATTANAVAEQVGIDEVVAEVLPDQKASTVQSLQTSAELVAMVGDGINDAPALANADVGFAIGTGTDIAIESADITLMGDSLMGVAKAIAISRATMTNIRQNLFGAFFYNSLGIPVAAGILYPLGGILLNPAVAAAAMALSSVTVVSNANRLRAAKLRVPAVQKGELS